MSPEATVASSTGHARRATMDRLAGRLAGLGATLGILAGLVDVAVGGSIRDWIGNKLNPAPLGLTTIVLSAIALAGAVSWERSGARDGNRRLATVLAFVIPAGICFTTIGRLWYLPGVLLLVAAGLVLAASTRKELRHTVNHDHWLAALVALLGGYYLFLGGDTLPRTAGVLGILGGVVIWAALVTTHGSHRLRLALLILGALPFAIATWWSIVTPLIALLVLSIGPAAIRPNRADRDAGHGPRKRAPAPAG